MTTLSPTKARGNLTALLKRAAAGEDIGILYGDHVIALRLVEVESTDYALREYGMTDAEMKQVEKKLSVRIQKNLKKKNFRTYTGDIEALLKD